MRPRPLLALFSISLAALALEVLQMRMFAFALWHHLAFLVISIAVLGFGASGAILASSRRLREADPGRSLAGAGLGFAAAAFVGPVLLAAAPIDLFHGLGARELSLTALYYLAFALPYFFAGWAVSSALTRAPEEAPRLYFANMLGSGAGCFLIFPALGPLGAGGTLLVIAALGALSAGLAGAGPRLRAGSLVALLLLLALAPFGEHLLQLHPARSKLLSYGREVLPDTEIVLTRWTPLCRIDVCRSPGTQSAFVLQDGDAPTPLPKGEPRTPEFATHTIGYSLKESPRVLIIGTGGGRDVQAALEYGARSVDGAEINPFTLSLSRDPALTDVADLVADRPEVRLEAAEGRFFVRRSPETYDVIQMTGVDTYTALASGAYVLSESYLYTREAFHDYLDHLAEDGVLSIVRFAFPAPRETLRTVVMACEVLRERGATEPWRHVAVLRQRMPDQAQSPFSAQTSVAAILVKRTPFDVTELAHLRRLAGLPRLVRDYIPGEDGHFTDEEIESLQQRMGAGVALHGYQLTDGMNPFYAWERAQMEGRTEAFLAGYPYDVTPVTDDAPFFFNQHRASDLWHWLRGGDASVTPPKGAAWVAMTELFQVRPIGMILLFLTLVQLAILSLVCILGPLVVFRREGIRGRGLLPAIGYFLCLGLGYILVMVPSMQRFGLLLGHPTWSISIVMSTFLIASGLGSLASAHVRLAAAPRALAVVAVVLIAGSLALQLGLPRIAPHVLRWDLPARALTAVACVAPLAFAMGMCFPIGVRLLSGRQRALVPWAYGVNGAGTVLGSVLAVCLALAVGFAAVQWIAVGLYALAALLLAALCRALPPRGASG